MAHGVLILDPRTIPGLILLAAIASHFLVTRSKTFVLFDGHLLLTLCS